MTNTNNNCVNIQTIPMPNNNNANTIKKLKLLMLKTVYNLPPNAINIS